MRNFHKFLLAFGIFNRFIVDDNGAGGGDVGDVDIDGGVNPDDGAEPDKTSTGEISTDDFLQLKTKLADADKTIKELAQDKELREKKEAQTSTINNLKGKYPEFDDSKVRDFLVELHKTNPDQAQELNNAVGWELVHLQNFAPKPVDNDVVDFGRNSGGVDRKDAIYEKLNSGGKASFNDKKALLSKYFID